MGRKSIAKERRTQIMEAFYRCTIEHGLSGATIRKIAGKAGLLPSTLHHYFKSRDEIIEEAVIYFTDMIFNDFNARMAEISDKEDKLSSGIEFIFSKGMINQEYTGFFLECCVAARNNNRIKQTIALLFRRFRQAIISHFEQVEGFEKLAIKDRQMLAAMIVGLHEGIELQWFADSSSVSLDKALESTLSLIRFFIQDRISIKNTD